MPEITYLTTCTRAHTQAPHRMIRFSLSATFRPSFHCAAQWCRLLASRRTSQRPPWGAYRLDEQLTVGENTVCSSWRHLFSTLCSPMEGVALVISAARLKWTFPSLPLVITSRSLRHTNGKIHPHKGANRNNAKQLLYNLQLAERFKVKYLFCYNSVHRFCASLKIISTVFPVAKFLAGLLENEEI